jgi:hypothetical protein
MSLKRGIKQIVYSSPSSAALFYLIRQRLQHPQDFSNFSEDEKKILYEIQKNGYVVIPDFIDKEFCNNCIKDIDLMMKNHQEVVQKYSDLRIFGSEHFSENIMRFADNKFLKTLANHYNTIETVNGFTLANVIEFSEESKKLGSGGGWHRDSRNRQFKAILYLNDVTEENGAYQIIKKSHKVLPLLDDIKTGGLDYKIVRYSDQQINKILNKNPERLHTITGKAGTMIIKDCSAIHRGSPLKSGIRYALTNYYFYRNQINTTLTKRFAPLASPEKVLEKAKATYLYN